MASVSPVSLGCSPRAQATWVGTSKTGQYCCLDKWIKWPSVINSVVCDIDSLDANSFATTKGYNEIALLGKSIAKHAESLVSVTRIDAKQKVTIAKMQAEEKDKGRNHQL